MIFSIDQSVEVLSRTPAALEHLIGGLSDEWIFTNERGDTWTVFDVMGHLINGEKTDWIPRMKIILEARGDKHFKPFDRLARSENSAKRNLDMLLIEFKQLRERNLEILKNVGIGPEQLDMEGIHPAFGRVSLSQLLSAWVVHDLTHIAQITRIMAFQYRDAVGPWTEYLGILNWRNPPAK